MNGIIDIGAYEVQQGECDGSAPQGPHDKMIGFVRTALAPHRIPQSEQSIYLSANLQMRPVPIISQDVAAARPQSETIPISHAAVSLHPAHDSLFMELEMGFTGIGH